MPDYELLKSLEKEGFSLDYPDSYSNNKKIISLLKEKEKRLSVAIPLLLEGDFDYDKIKKQLLKMKDGKNLLKEFRKIIMIAEIIFRKTKRNHKKLFYLIKKKNISEKPSKSEVNYYLEQFKESKKAKEMKVFEKNSLEGRKNIETFKALEKIFSPAKIRILRKIYNFDKLTPSERTYYYRDIKPMMDAILNTNLREYLEIIKGNKKQR